MIELGKRPLKHCWVCEQVFTEFGGPPSFFRHEHHLVPRAYGGVDGPTISLCDSHHTTLHQVALKLYSGKPYHQLLTQSPIQNKRILWLATVVVNARRIAENDPNKALTISIVADADLKAKLKKLKQVYPKASYAKLIRFALESLYRKHFQN